MTHSINAHQPESGSCTFILVSNKPSEKPSEETYSLPCKLAYRFLKELRDQDLLWGSGNVNTSFFGSNPRHQVKSLEITNGNVKYASSILESPSTAAAKIDLFVSCSACMPKQIISRL